MDIECGQSGAALSGQYRVQPETSQALTGIAVGNVDTVYGISAAGEVYQLVNTPCQPTPWAPMWHASTSPDGSVWGVGGNGNMFEWSNGQWQQRPNDGALALFVAVGADHRLHHYFKSPLWYARHQAAETGLSDAASSRWPPFASRLLSDKVASGPRGLRRARILL